MTNVALQRSDVKYAEFIAEMMQFNTDMFVFVDQTGSDRKEFYQEIWLWLERIVVNLLEISKITLKSLLNVCIIPLHWLEVRALKCLVLA